MKTKILFCLLSAFCFQLSAFAVDVITATITITNAAGTTNGQTLSITNTTSLGTSWSVRTWTNSVVVTATQILTNSTPEGSATNLLNQLGGYPIAYYSLSYASATAVAARAFPGVVPQIVLSAGWGTVVYTTNVLTSAVAVRVPYTVEAAAQRTNVASGLVDWLNLSATTQQLAQASAAMAQLVGTTNTQTISGDKTWTGTNVFSGVFTEYFSASNSQSFIYLQGGLLYMGGAAAIIKDSAGANVFSVNPTLNYMSYPGTATNLFYEAHPTYAVFRAPGNLPTLGWDTNWTFLTYWTNGVQQGYVAVTNGGVLISGNTRLAHALEVTGVSRFSGGVSNLVTVGTNSFSDISFRRYAITSLANGNNAGIVVGTNTFVQVSGPSGAFTINGLNGSPNRDGHVVKILNRTGQNMTIANDSGTEPVAANRIYTLTGADVGPSTGDCIATFIYSTADARWILDTYSP